MFRYITNAEKRQIDSVLAEITGFESSSLWSKSQMILIHRKQNRVYVVPPRVLDLLKTIDQRKSRTKGLKLEFACKEIGVLMQDDFHIGLEVIYELAAYVEDKFVVNQTGELDFLFGKDISRENVLSLPRNYIKGKKVIVFSKDMCPLGLAQYESTPEEVGSSSNIATNLIDFGYYLRSGG